VLIMKRGLWVVFSVCFGCGSSPQSFTASDEGSTVSELHADGELRFAQDGTLIPGPETVRSFDFQLADRDREALPAIRTRIPGAARDLFDRYVSYLYRASRDASDVDSAMIQTRQLRREVFGETTAGALFSEQERLADFALAARKIILDR